MYLNSLIIINYNNANLTIQTLQSIYKHKHNEQIEVILIDNASKIDDFAIIEKYVLDNQHLNIVVYRSRINVGFGAGNMLGVNLANGKYYTFINNDVIIIEDTFNKLTSFLEQNNDVSVVGCQAIDEDRIKYKTFDYQLSLATELFSTSFLHFLSKKKYPNRLAMFSEPTQVGAVPGSLFTCRATDFNADWCGPCKMVAPILEELGKDYKGKVNIYKVDTEAEQELAGAFGIRSIPSMLFIPKNGEPQMSQGALPKHQLEQVILDVLGVTK